MNCLSLDPRTGLFLPTSGLSLGEERSGHLCWEVEGEGGEILLLGGDHQDSQLTTELINSNSSTPSFPLKYDTM